MTWKYFGAIVAVLAIMAVGSLPVCSAEEGKNIEQMITEAKTPADHEAIAAYYEKEAQAAHQEHERHKKLKDFYGLTPKLKSGEMFRHCEALAKKYAEIAEDYEALAKLHRGMAAPAK